MKLAKSEAVMISAKNVSKTFKLPHEKQASIKGAFINMFAKTSIERQKVLESISFDVYKGEFLGIVGRNGSGKSTLLKIISGIYVPNKGSVSINGSLVPFIELGVGFNPDLTGKENVFLNGALLGFNKTEMEAMYHEIVAFAELEKFMDQKLKNYSSGMQVRLAFSIAIRANSDILVLDEVLAVGDANFQKKCYDYFQQLKNSKKTVILVSHDMESVKRFATRAVMLEEGKIVADGDPEYVSDKYTLSNIERSRQGSTQTQKTAIIKNVKVLDKNSNDIKNIDTNQNISIRIQYDASKVKDEINFGVGMHLATGGYVFSYNTKMDKVDIKDKKGTLSLNIDKLNLLKGNYYINVICFGVNEAVPYEYLPKVMDIYVSPTGLAGSYRGIVNMKHDWSG